MTPPETEYQDPEWENVSDQLAEAIAAIILYDRLGPTRRDRAAAALYAYRDEVGEDNMARMVERAIEHLEETASAGRLS